MNVDAKRKPRMTARTRENSRTVSRCNCVVLIFAASWDNWKARKYARNLIIIEHVRNIEMTTANSKNSGWATSVNME